MATMTFQVNFKWSGDKPNIIKRKMLEAEFARVNNWLKVRSAGLTLDQQQLNELVRAYCLVNNNLKMNYEVNAMGELIGSIPDRNCYVTFELGQTL